MKKINDRVPLAVAWEYFWRGVKKVSPTVDYYGQRITFGVIIGGMVLAILWGAMWVVDRTAERVEAGIAIIEATPVPTPTPINYDIQEVIPVGTPVVFEIVEGELRMRVLP